MTNVVPNTDFWANLSALDRQPFIVELSHATGAAAHHANVADIISNEEAECRSKEAGDACTVGGEAGTCAKSTCARNDYSEGVPPKTKQVECMICQPGKAPEPPPTEAKAEEAKGAEAKEPTQDAPAKGEAESKADTKTGACSVGVDAPAGLGVLLLGLAAWSRRRR